MEETALREARLRYESAYLAYKECAARMAEKLRLKSVPTADDLRAEAEALTTLTGVRARLLELIRQSFG